MDLNDTATTYERVDDTPSSTVESAPATPPTLEQSLDTMIGEKTATPAPVTETAPAPDPALATTQPPADTTVATPEAAVPADTPPPAPEPPAPTYLEQFSTLAAEPIAEALPKAIEVIQQFAAYDPPAEDLLFRTMYAANRADIHRIALGEMGVDANEVKTFNDWVAAGKQALQLPDAPPAFPEPNADGIVVLPSGAQLDVNVPEDAEIYANSKFRHEYAIQQREQQAQAAKATAEAAEKTRIDNERKQHQEVAQRQTAFRDARLGVINKTITEALKLAPGDEWMSEMVMAYAYAQVDTDDGLGKLASAADPYVAQGAGRANDYARDMDAKIKVITNSVIDKFSTRFLRAASAETKLYNSQPILPPGTKVVGANATPPPADNYNPSGSSDDIMRQGAANLEQALANRFAQ